MENKLSFEITIASNGKREKVLKKGYLTPLFAFRDAIKEHGLKGAFVWVSIEDTERFNELDNCAYFKGYHGDYDGVYLNQDEFTLIGKSTKDLNEPTDERELFDENSRPEGYFVSKAQVNKVIEGLEEIITDYQGEGDGFQYRVDCAKENIQLLEKVSDENKKYLVNPDKSYGDGVADAFANANCDRCLIVE